MEKQTHYPKQNDELGSVVAAAQTGDRQAFNQLILRYQDLVVNLCAGLMGNRSDGEDAAQDTFIKAYHQLGSFRGEAQFSTWLHTIAVNICRNKHHSFWQRLFRRAARDCGDDGNDTLMDSAPLASQELEKKELRGQINQALGKLPVRFRELIVLRDLKQFSYTEIAQIMGVPEGTIKSGIARARSALQMEFKGLIDGY